jgi:hypothetical protein
VIFTGSAQAVPEARAKAAADSMLMILMCISPAFFTG